MRKSYAKILCVLLVAVLCCTAVFALAACKGVKKDAPRFSGMTISKTSPLKKASADESQLLAASKPLRPSTAPLRDNESDATPPAGAEAESDGGAAGEAPEAGETPDASEPSSGTAQDEYIEVPADDMPEKDSAGDIEDVVLPEISVKPEIAQDVFYAELNQEVYISVRLVNPKSYAILRFTLNGMVYQSYQFEDGSNSELLVLKVESGNIPGLKQFTIDEIKYVDGKNNIRDCAIDGETTVDLRVAYARGPEVSIVNETVDLTSYKATISVTDPNKLVDFENGGCRLYVFDGLKWVETALKTGLNEISMDHLIFAKTYQWMVVADYDNFDKEGMSTHVLYKMDVSTCQFCRITDLVANYDKVTFDYRVLNSMGAITDVYLFDGNYAVAKMGEEKSFDGLLANHEYELRLYFTADIAGQTLVLYDSVKFTTKAYKVPSVSASFKVLESSVIFDVNVDDESDVLTPVAVRLYTQNGEFVRSVPFDEHVIEGLNRNTNYILKISYIYNLKDGKGDIEGERTMVFSTSKAVPVVEIRPVVATQSSLSFDVIVTDPNVVGTINSLRLYKKDGNAFVTQLNNLALREFTGLQTNTEYVVEVGYIYDLDDGNGSQVITFTQDFATAKRTPTYDVSCTADTESVTVTLNEVDPDNAGALSNVAVYDGNELVKETAEVSQVATISGLLSNHSYTAIATYTYDTNDRSGEHSKDIIATFKTAAKEEPSFKVAANNITYSSFDYNIAVVDKDSVCVIDSVKVMLGTTEVLTLENTDPGTLKDLYSNNKYTFRFAYHYDLNDGKGRVDKVATKDVSTLKRENVSISHDNLLSGANSISFGYKINDPENLITITKIELYNAAGELEQALEDLTIRVFENLEASAFYTLKTTYTYDLNDNKGLQTEVISTLYGTSGAKVFVNALHVINTQTPQVGEEVQVRITLDNASNANITALYIAGQRCENLANSDDSSDVIVKFTPDTEGGRITVAVTAYEYETNGVRLKDELVSEFSEEIMVMGEVSIQEYFAISDSKYENYISSPMRMLTIYNPTGYRVTSIQYLNTSNTYELSERDYATTTDFTMIDNNHILIKELGYNMCNYGNGGNEHLYDLAITAITYGIDGIEKTLSFAMMHSVVGLYNSVVHISTAEELLEISRDEIKNDWYDPKNLHNFYILDNDIDLRYHKLDGLYAGGVFDGQGHTIYNATIVIEDDSQNDAYYGLFSIFNGMICDLNLKNVYYSVKTNGKVSVAGISAAKTRCYNCSVTGAINVTAAGGVVSGVANRLYSVSNINENSSEYNYTANYYLSTNNWVENLKITHSNGVFASLVTDSNRFRTRINGSYQTQEVTYTAGQMNCAAFGKSSVYNIDTEAYTYKLFANDTDETGKLYVDKEVFNVDYNIVTNFSGVNDFTVTAAVLNDIDVKRDGYMVSWYEKADFTGDEVSFPYINENGATLYAKWTRIAIADNSFTYYDYWNSSVVASKTINSFNNPSNKKAVVVGGYINGKPVSRVDWSAYRELVVTNESDDWTRLNDYTFYYTSTLGGDIYNRTMLYVGKVAYIQGRIPYADISFNTWEGKLYVAAEDYNYYLSLITRQFGSTSEAKSHLATYNANNNPFDKVVNWAASDDEHVTIAATGFDAENLRESVKMAGSALPYEVVFDPENDAKELTFGDTKFLVMGDNVYVGISKIDHDDNFRYIVLEGGNAVIDALLNPNLTTLDLTACPYNIVKISDGVFARSRISSIVFGGSLQEIGTGAFQNCPNLKAIVIPDSVTKMGAYAFGGCNSLNSVVLGSGLTYVPDSAFASCNVNSLVLGKNIREIGVSAFECTQLNTVIIPDHVTTIGRYAFNSGNIKLVYLPSSVKTVNEYAFPNNSDLTICSAFSKKPGGWNLMYSDNTEPDNRNYCWGIAGLESNDTFMYVVNSNGEATILALMDASATTLDLSIEGYTVVAISDSAFANNSKLKVVTMPDTVKTIGARAFEWCTSLQSVTLSQELTSIGDYAFRYCRNLRSVTLPDTLKSIGEGAFQECYAITKIELPDGLEVIGNRAFCDVNSLNVETLTIPLSVRSIGERAFYCSNVKFVVFEGTPDTLGTQAFYYARTTIFSVRATAAPAGWESDWSVVEYDSGEPTVIYGFDEIVSDGTFNFIVTADGSAIILKYLKNNAFTVDIKLDNYVVTEIAAGAFESRSNLQKVYMANTITKIGYRAFAGCSSLQTVTLSESLEYVGKYAFLDCYNMRGTLTIPQSVNYIGEQAFRCDEVSCVFLVGTPQIIDSRGFYYAPRAAFYVPAASAPAGWADNWAVVDWDNTTTTNVFFGFEGVDQNETYKYAKLSGNRAVILEYLGDKDVIWDNGESNMIDLVIAIDGYDVVGIGPAAFRYCHTLRSVVIPDTVTDISTGAFESCSNLHSVTMSANIVNIGGNAFWNVYIDQIVLPRTLEYIGGGAFLGFNGAGTVYYTGSSSEWDRIAIDNWNNTSFMNANFVFNYVAE